MMAAGVKIPGIVVGLRDFRELSLCGPCEPCFSYSPYIEFGQQNHFLNAQER